MIICKCIRHRTVTSIVTICVETPGKKHNAVSSRKAQDARQDVKKAGDLTAPNEQTISWQTLLDTPEDAVPNRKTMIKKKKEMSKAAKKEGITISHLFLNGSCGNVQPIIVVKTISSEPLASLLQTTAPKAQ